MDYLPQHWHQLVTLRNQQQQRYATIRSTVDRRFLAEAHLIASSAM
jgi:hypothetical protein